MDLKHLHIIPVDYASPAYDETIHLRNRLLKKPIDIDFTKSELAREYEDIHLACYNASFELLACLVLEPIDQSQIKMRQVAVEEAVQKQGIGTLLVDESERIAQKMGFQTMVLHARENAIPFYKRLDYQKEGASFEEVGLAHFKMRKKL